MTPMEDTDFYLYAELPSKYTTDMAKSVNKRLCKPQHKIKSKWVKLKQANDKLIAKLSAE